MAESQRESKRTFLEARRQLLTLAEEVPQRPAALLELRNVVQDQLGELFRGYLAVKRDDFMVKFSSKQVMGNCELRGGFYVIVQELTPGRYHGSAPIDLRGTAPATWAMGQGGNQWGRRNDGGVPMDIRPVQSFCRSLGCDIGGELYAWAGDRARQSWNNTGRRCFIISLREAFGSSSSSGDPPPRVSEAAPAPQPPLTLPEPPLAAALGMPQAAAEPALAPLVTAGPAIPTSQAADEHSDFQALSPLVAPGDLGDLPLIEEEFSSDPKRPRYRGGGSAIAEEKWTTIAWLSFCAEDDVQLDLNDEKTVIEAVLAKHGEISAPNMLPRVKAGWGRFVLKEPESGGPLTLRTLADFLYQSVCKKPLDFLHFAGHGNENPLHTITLGSDSGDRMLAGYYGVTRPKSPTNVLCDQGLAGIFSVYQQDTHGALKGIVLNCCHSKAVGQSLCDNGSIPFVVGHIGKLDDRLAIRFAELFWGHLCCGMAPEDACTRAKREIGCMTNYVFMTPTDPKVIEKRIDKEIESSPWSTDLRKQDIKEQYEADLKLAAELSHHVEEVPELWGYQEEMLQACQKENTLVVLPTGAGKTAVAFSMMLDALVNRRSETWYWGKKVAFLTKTVPLMFQQARAFQRYAHGKLPLEATGKFCADAARLAGGGYASKRAVFFTAGLFKNLLEMHSFRLSDFSLIVFDEAHNTRGKDDFAEIMRSWYWTLDASVRPRMIGLSATPADGKNIDANVQNIIGVCLTLDSGLATPQTTKSELDKVCQKPKLRAVPVDSSTDEDYINTIMLDYVDKLHAVVLDLATKDEKNELRFDGLKDVAGWLDWVEGCRQFAEKLAEPCKAMFQHLVQILDGLATYHDCNKGIALDILRTSVDRFATEVWPSTAKPEQMTAFLNSIFDNEIIEELRSDRFPHLVDNAMSSAEIMFKFRSFVGQNFLLSDSRVVRSKL